MNKLIGLVFFLSLSTFSFSKNKHPQELERLRQTELEFSKMCGEKGMKESFIYYADKDVIKPRDEQFPIIGKDSLITSYSSKKKETFKLEWYPVRVEVSISADLGYTFGNWILTSSDSKKSYGNYAIFLFFPEGDIISIAFFTI